MAESTTGSSAFRNPISVAGAIIVTIAAALFLTVFAIDLLGIETNPYVGIIFFLIVPAVFVLGLALIPLGGAIERRRRRRGTAKHYEWPRIDLNNATHRRVALAVLALTVVNILIVSLAAYRGVEYMDSVEFCGQVCHQVMQPEHVAYQDGPHSRVACVRCHIGPGAPWFVKAKIDGTRQVIAVMRNSYSRPISSPVHDLRPARDVCEQCHWPEKFHGDKVVVRKEYADDEAVSESVTTLRVHVGGGSDKLGIAAGIHWHMNIANKVDYISTDGRRQVIPYVKLTTPEGEVREYRVEGVSQADLDRGEHRRMDCVDCHNRPSHPFAPSPERAVDAAIAAGAMPRTLPFIRREAVESLKAKYATREAADEDIRTRLVSFYRTGTTNIYDSRRNEVDRAVEATRRIYSRNVFPAMNVTWGTHPNNIGHMDAPGCFRCHDDNHKTKDGRVIKQDCELCHAIE
jgi:NapC/NirT cytochrome c family protein